MKEWLTYLGVLAIILFISGAFFIVDTTERAAVLRFGVLIESDVPPGLHFKIPFIDSVLKYKYTYLTEDFVGKRAVTVLSKDGLPVSMDVSIIYRLNTSPGEIYKRFGPYKNLHSWFVATARGTIRDVIAKYNVEELYSENREAIAGEIAAELEKRLSPWIEVQSVQIRKITLPQQVVQAIEEKLKAQQEAQRMQYVIMKEKLEKERKKIEAEAIATATEIIARALDQNPGYIKWYYMKVLEKFAETNNNTIILVPVSGDYYPDVNGMSLAGMLMNVGGVKG